MLFVNGEIAGSVLLARFLALDYLAAFEKRNDAIDLVILVGRFFARTGNDERRTRLIYKDGVDLIDNGEIMLALHAIVQAEFHVIAQVVEAEFIVRSVSDIGAVSGFALVVIEVVDDGPDGQTKKFVKPAHPLRIALRQIIVDRNNVYAFAAEPVEITGQGGDERLALAGFHFGDPAAVQFDAADQLHVEMPHIQNAAARFAAYGERFNENIVERSTVRNLLFEFDGFGRQLLVRERLHLGLKIVNGRNHRPQTLHFAVVLRAKNLGKLCLENHKYFCLQCS